MLRLAIFPSVLAAPVLAHGGAHLHPHGAAVWGPLLLVAMLAGACLWLWSSR